MTKFLTGKNLEDKLTDIIWDARKYIILISPFIKLDDHVKSIFDKIKVTHEVHLILLFGKNEGYKQRSFNSEDFQYFKSFKNISILYNKDLHAKHYCNEKEGLITSLNLYDYSMINNVEYGVHFIKNILNPTDKLFEETEEFTDELIFKNSELVFLKKPIFKKKMFGLSKTYQSSKILFDVSDLFFNNKAYEIRYLDDFDYEEYYDIDKSYDIKPQRTNSKEIRTNNSDQMNGFCIRTGENIPFNMERPYSYNAYKIWVKFQNRDYEENYCHKTGVKSFGKTSMNSPVL